MGIDGREWNEVGSFVFESFANGHHTEHYFKDVIEPALRTLADQIDEYETKQEGAWPFVVQHIQTVEKATVEAFALALQSIWERQLRRYLGTHKPQDFPLEKLEKANWGELQYMFRAWRPFGLDEFDSFAWLDLLQELGNACRHGDGRASRVLFKRYPELWPNWPPKFVAPLPDMIRPPVLPTGEPPFRDIVIPEHFLQRCSEAIGWFWADIEYLYNRSLQHPDEYLVQRLNAVRDTWGHRKKEITY